MTLIHIPETYYWKCEICGKQDHATEHTCPKECPDCGSTEITSGPVKHGGPEGEHPFRR